MLQRSPFPRPLPIDIVNMDLSSKDFSRAKYKLSQSRKPAQRNGGRSGGTLQQCHVKAGPKQPLRDQPEGPSSVKTQDEDTAMSDHLDLQSLLDTAWTAPESSRYHRHAAMLESLVQQGTVNSHSDQYDVANLDLRMLIDQLQQCPEHLISGVHPSVAPELPQTAVLGTRMSSPGNGDSGHAMPSHAARLEPNYGRPSAIPSPRSRYTLATSRLPTAQHQPSCDPSGSAVGHRRTSQPTPAAALPRPSKGATEAMENDMEDDLDRLLASSSNSHAPPPTNRVASSGPALGHQPCPAAQTLTPHQSRQSMPKTRSPGSTSRPTARSDHIKADLEDWLDL